MTNILALETATETCSVALATADGVLSRFEYAPRKQTELVLPMIEALLAEAGMERAGLDYVAFGNGPGAFTGVRVAVAIAQGLGYGLSVPLVPVSTLQIQAQTAYRKHGVEKVLSVFDARMGEVYAGFYSVTEAGGATAVQADMVVSPEELLYPDTDHAWVAAGSGCIYRDSFPRGEKLAAESYDGLFPEAEDIPGLACREIALGNVFSAAEVEPVYLRDNVAKKKNRQ